MKDGSRWIRPHYILGRSAKLTASTADKGVRSNAALPLGEGSKGEAALEYVIFMLYVLLLCLEVSAKSVSCAVPAKEVVWDVMAPQMLWI